MRARLARVSGGWQSWETDGLPKWVNVKCSESLSVGSVSDLELVNGHWKLKRRKLTVGVDTAVSIR